MESCAPEEEKVIFSRSELNKNREFDPNLEQEILPMIMICIKITSFSTSVTEF